MTKRKTKVVASNMLYASFLTVAKRWEIPSTSAIFSMSCLPTTYTMNVTNQLSQHPKKANIWFFIDSKK